MSGPPMGYSDLRVDIEDLPHVLVSEPTFVNFLGMVE